MKKEVFIAGLIALALPLAASAQSTITGTLSSGGTVTTGSGSTLTGTVTPAPGSGTLTGTVGGGGSGSLTGTVTAPSTSGTTGGGGGGGGSNGPPAGGGGGGGSGLTIVCPNLPDSLYSLPAGYVVIDGNCDPGSGSVLGASTSIPNAPNTGAGGEAPINLAAMFASLIAAAGGVSSFLRLRRR